MTLFPCLQDDFCGFDNFKHPNLCGLSQISAKKHQLKLAIF